jgi:chaperonin GroEL
MSKALLYSRHVRQEQDLHQELLEGVAQIALAVASTLGPRGCNVIIDRPGETPDVTKDGVTVARNIQLTNPVHHAAVKMIQDVAKAHELETGDGTTTATVLAHRLFEGGLQLVDQQGESPVGLQRAILAAVEAVVAQVRRLAREATDEQIVQVASIATNGDAAFGQVIGEAIGKVGRDGILTLDDSKEPRIWFEARDGFRMNSGFLWPDFITDRGHGTAVLENPYILITERQLSQGIGQNPTLHDIGPLMTFCAGLNRRGDAREREPRPLLIVADDVLHGSDCAQALLINHSNWDKSRRGIPVQGGGLQICAVRAPGYGELKRSALSDLALATGGRVLTQDGGEALSQWVLDDKRGRWTDANLGQCRRAVVSNGRVILEGPAGDAADPGLLPRFAQSLRQQAQEQTDPQSREHLLQRAGRLTGMVGVIHVGAKTEAESKALRALAEDAVLAVRAALAEGVVPGGGLTLFLLAEQLSNTVADLPKEAQAGAHLLAAAMQWPMRQIAINAGQNPDEVADEVLLLNSTGKQSEKLIGFNAANGRYEEMIGAGIVDPAKVVRVALEKASSIAALMLTTSCLVYLDPQVHRQQPIIQLPQFPMQPAMAGRGE